MAKMMYCAWFSNVIVDLCDGYILLVYTMHSNQLLLQVYGGASIVFNGGSA